MAATDIIFNFLNNMSMETILMVFPVIVIVIALILFFISALKDRKSVTPEPTEDPLAAAGRTTSIIPKEKSEEDLEVPQKIPEQPQEKKESEQDFIPGEVYLAQLKEIQQMQDLNCATDRLSLLINQFFSRLLKLNYQFTYAELSKELEKKGKKEFSHLCDKLAKIHFSKDQISKQEFQQIFLSFENILQSLKSEMNQKTQSEEPKSKIGKFLNAITQDFKLRFSEEVTGHKNVIKKFFTGGKNFVKEGIFLEKKTPSKISFQKVLTDIGKEKSEEHKQFKKIIGEKKKDEFTIEGWVYTLIFKFKRNMKDSKTKKEIYKLMEEGKKALAQDNILAAQTIYYSIIPLYNMLTPKEKEKVLKNLAIFYEGIDEEVKFQKLNMLVLQFKQAIKEKNLVKARTIYDGVKKIYNAVSQKHKQRVYSEMENLSSLLS